MKNYSFLIGLSALISTFLFTACTPEDIDYSSTTREIISKGNWTVDYFYSGQDKTAQYSTYQFTFLGDGTVQGTTGTAAITGTWNIVLDVDRKEILTIDITTPHILELNDHWNVLDVNKVMVVMKDSDNDQLRLKRL